MQWYARDILGHIQWYTRDILGHIQIYTEKICNDILKHMEGVLTSSGTALMFVKPFLKMTNTFFAPQRRADVAQSKAVSPAPSTITVPRSTGRDVCLHEHIPVGQRQLNFTFLPPFLFLSPSPSLRPSPGLLAAATTGKKSLEVKKPFSAVNPSNMGTALGSGKPIPTKMASYPSFSSPLIVRPPSPPSPLPSTT